MSGPGGPWETAVEWEPERWKPRPRVESWRAGLRPEPCMAGAVGPPHLSVMCHTELHTRAMGLNLTGKVSWGLTFWWMTPMETSHRGHLG